MTFDRETAYAVTSLLQDERFKKFLAYVATSGDEDMKSLLGSRQAETTFYFQGRVAYLHEMMNAIGGAEHTAKLYEEQDDGPPST